MFTNERNQKRVRRRQIVQHEIIFDKNSKTHPKEEASEDEKTSSTSDGEQSTSETLALSCALCHYQQAASISESTSHGKCFFSTKHPSLCMAAAWF